MSEAANDDVGVVIVDDHQVFTESLARLLGDEDGIRVLGTANCGSDGLTLAARLKPRVALVDYEMPDIDGVAVTAQMKAECPQTMVVMLTGFTDDRVLTQAIEAGCSGFLTKDRAAAEVAEAVRRAAIGEALISPEMLARLLPRLSRTHHSVGDDLTNRELDVLRQLARGATNRTIAEELFLSVNTVRNYVQAILTKLGAHSKLEAVSKAVREGIIDFGPAVDRS
jgi:two-component system, NarL family, response regulator DevR